MLDQQDYTGKVAAMSRLSRLARLILPDGTPDAAVSTRLVLTGVLVPSFYAFDWVLVGITAGLVSLLVVAGLGERGIWLILWGCNIILSAGIVLFGDRLGVDLTMMQSLRRVTDLIHARSKRAGWICEAALIVRLLLWDGPAFLLIFIRRRVSSESLGSSILVPADGHLLEQPKMSLRLTVWSLVTILWS